LGSTFDPACFRCTRQLVRGWPARGGTRDDFEETEVISGGLGSALNTVQCAATIVIALEGYEGVRAADPPPECCRCTPS
jgi:hypothetical protein